MSDNKKLAWENVIATVDKMVAIKTGVSGAAIYVTLETMKFFHGKEIQEIVYIKYSGILALITIVAVFAMQYCSYKANYLTYRSEVNLEMKKKKKAEKLECQSDIYNKVAIWLNIASTITVGLSLFLLIIFFFVYV